MIKEESKTKKTDLIKTKKKDKRKDKMRDKKVSNKTPKIA